MGTVQMAMAKKGKNKEGKGVGSGKPGSSSAGPSTGPTLNRPAKDVSGPSLSKGQKKRLKKAAAAEAKAMKVRCDIETGKKVPSRGVVLTPSGSGMSVKSGSSKRATVFPLVSRSVGSSSPLAGSIFKLPDTTSAFAYVDTLQAEIKHNYEVIKLKDEIIQKQRTEYDILRDAKLDAALAVSKGVEGVQQVYRERLASREKELVTLAESLRTSREVDEKRLARFGQLTLDRDEALEEVQVMTAKLASRELELTEVRTSRDRLFALLKANNIPTPPDLIPDCPESLVCRRERPPMTIESEEEEPLFPPIPSPSSTKGTPAQEYSMSETPTMDEEAEGGESKEVKQERIERMVLAHAAERMITPDIAGMFKIDLTKETDSMETEV